MPKLITFVCDACGTKGDRSPYVCHQCDFVMHQNCAHLPCIIYVNRHDHRVSYTYPLGPGEWKCGVCWEEIDWSCGAYSCSVCLNYVVHSKCATRKYVWDGKELDGVPEEIEDIKPFKVNDDGTITHFAHEHNLSLNEDGIALEESILCRGCIRPIGSTIFYKCSDCSFILHEACANLPLRRRHFLSPKPLALKYWDDGFSSINECLACLQYFGEGFMYVDGPFKDKLVDLVCISVTDPFTHGSHPHPLLYIKMDAGDKMITTCQSCGLRPKTKVLGCTKCKFYLDFRCATLPSTVTLHMYDDHPLTLCYGEKASGKYWCDICERETNPETWFYTCKDCGVTLHILCVLGDLRHVRPGQWFKEGFTLLPNSSSSRPICNVCHCRCPGPFTLMDDDNIFFCSFFCLTTGKWWWGWQKLLICPPWVDELVVLIHKEESRKTQRITKFPRSKSI